MSVLRVGSRKSPLARVQAQYVIELLEPLGIPCEPFHFVTSGDRFLEGPLRSIGGKGLFTKEIEEALLRHEIDCAVHSYKDMPAHLPPGLMIGAVLEREDARDAWIGQGHIALKDLPKGSRVGTASLRRQVQLKLLFPHLEIVEIRGNILTRLDKMNRGDVDGLILAHAGLKRLGHLDWITETLSFDHMFPAVSQGALAVECRVGDEKTLACIQKINHPDSALCTSVERAFLEALDGSCRTPIGGFAYIEDEFLHFKGFISKPNATKFEWIEKRFSVLSVIDNPHEVGFQIGQELEARFKHA